MIRKLRYLIVLIILQDSRNGVISTYSVTAWLKKRTAAGFCLYIRLRCWLFDWASRWCGNELRWVEGFATRCKPSLGARQNASLHFDGLKTLYLPHLLHLVHVFYHHGRGFMLFFAIKLRESVIYR